MTTIANVFYWGIIGILALLAVLALTAGWWTYTLAAVVLGGCFAFAGHIALGRCWPPAEPHPTRRPVVRRRR